MEFKRLVETILIFLLLVGVLLFLINRFDKLMKLSLSFTGKFLGYE